MTHKPTIPETLYAAIAAVVQQTRQCVKQAVNQQMVQAYWHIGRLIVEEEQQGKERAEYGKQQLEQISRRLQADFGRGFDVRNLRNMRAFYQCYPNWNAVRTELSWTHYRVLIRIEKLAAREWYANEAVEQNWSARALERQLGVLYYERLLASKDKQLVEQEAQEKTAGFLENPKDYLRDPYILDFLNLQDKTYEETDLEQAIITNLQHFLLELGKGFAFVERQQRIRTEDGDYFIERIMKPERELLIASNPKKDLA